MDFAVLYGDLVELNRNLARAGGILVRLQHHPELRSRTLRARTMQFRELHALITAELSKAVSSAEVKCGGSVRLRQYPEGAQQQ